MSSQWLTVKFPRKKRQIQNLTKNAIDPANISNPGKNVKFMYTGIGKFFSSHDFL